MEAAIHGSGPTRGAERTPPSIWGARPGLARAVRATTVLLPIAVAAVVAILVGPSLPRWHGAWGLLAWWAQLAALSTVVVVIVDRFGRRALPLAGLLNLSLVFPDEAPSRFKVALRAGSTNRLRTDLELSRPDETAQEAATRLLALVAKLGAHDRLTRGHTERVRAYSDLIATELGLSDDDRRKLSWAVLLHDIGKLSVRAEILNKVEPLTDDEWQVLRGHPAAGAEMVAPLADWLGDWVLATGQHHERWDGKGYPNGLAGVDISLAGRIVALADAYDVITSLRSYKAPMSAAVARQEMVRCAGTQFDPDVVRAFLRVSLGRLRLVGGPLAWLASLPLGGNSGLAASAAANAVVVASVIGVTLFSGIARLPDGDAAKTHRVPPMHRSHSVHHASPSSTTTTTDPVSDGTTSSTTSAPTTTTIAPSLTTVPVAVTRRSTSPTTDPVATGTTRTPATTPSTPTTLARAGSPPNVVADVAAVGENTTSTVAVPIDVLANDRAGSAQLDPATLQLLSGSSVGAVVAVSPAHVVLYTAPIGFIGTDSLAYQVCDTDGFCASATLTIHVA